MDLQDVLNRQRQHVLGAADGLSDEDLRRPMLPSGWSILGLINHLAYDVELFWFRAVLAGEQSAIDEVSVERNAWQVPDDEPAADVLNRYQQQVALANAIISVTPEDAAPAWWPENQFGGWRLETHRALLLHVITETATHSGHLDAVRELIDGKQWLVLTRAPR